MKAFWVLFKKDLALELRRKESLTLLISLSLLLALTVSLGINNLFLPMPTVTKIYIPLLWLISILCGTLASSRSYEYEMENAAYEGVLLTGISSPAIFLAKLLSNFLILICGHFFSAFALAAFLDVDISAAFLAFFVISCATIFGFTCLATLLAAISVNSQLKGLLLPLLLLPLSLPLFFAGSELSFISIYEGGSLFDSIWLGLLVGLDLLYLTLGAWLFEHCLKG